METGTVKFFNQSKGYGFIVNDSDQSELFVHVTGCNEDINEGDTVQFEVTDGKKGPNATNVNKS